MPWPWMKCTGFSRRMSQMAVASAMVDTYRRTPYGLVLLVGDISYYGSIEQRFDDVFAEPFRPLIDAGAEFELAIGNHEIEEERSEDAAAEIAAQLRRLGKPGTYYSVVHGPMEVFVLDTSIPGVTSACTVSEATRSRRCTRGSASRYSSRAICDIGTVRPLPIGICRLASSSGDRLCPPSARVTTGIR